MPHSRTIRTERHERLARVIARDVEPIIETWARRARDEQPAARRLHHEALLDDLPAFLHALAQSLDETDEARVMQHRQPAFRHGEQRWQAGWSLPELIRDYQLLRIVVLEHVDATLDRPLRVREVLALNLAFDDAIAASVGMYVAEREQSVRRSERERADAEHDEVEQQLRQHAAALQEVDRRKDEFLAILGHELRNPLAPISNVVQALQLQAPDPQTLHWATGVVERQVRHMSRLVEDLLDLTRISQGRVLMRPDRLNLAGLLRQVADDQRAALTAAGLGFHLELCGDPVWVRADADRLTQIVRNLLHNATKFTPPDGQVTLRLEHDAAVTRAVVTVMDTGIGIDAAELPQLFQAFRQIERTVHQSKGGLGLGLALVKGLVELHGGAVSVTSGGLGLGAAFTFELPLDRAAESDPPTLPAPSA